MPAKRLLPVLIAGTGWVLLVLLAWKWTAGLVGPAVESFTCMSRYPVPPFAQVMRQILVNFSGLAVLALAVFGMNGLGRRALDWTNSPAVSPAEDFAARALTGIGLFCTAVFALGLAGLLFPSVMYPVAGTALLMAYPLRLPVFPIPRLSPSPLGIAVALALAILALFSLAPETTVDALVYHLAAPAHYRSIHRIADAPHIMYRWPLLTEQFLTAFPGLVPQLAYRGLGLLLLVLLMYGWIRRRYGESAALLGVLFLLASPASATLATVVKPDLFASAFVLLGVLAWDRIADGRGTGVSPAVLCGAALGFAFCAKMTTASAAVAMICWHALFPRTFPVRRILVAVAAFVAVSGPFLGRGWLATGNPGYPYWFGGLGWSEINNWLMLNGWPFPDTDPGYLPDTAASLGRFLSSEALPALFGISVLALAGSTAPGTGAGRLLSWTVLFVAAQVWILRAPYMRFAIPVVPVLCGIGAAGAAGLARRTGPLWAGILVGLLVIPGFIRVVALSNMSGPKMKLTLPVALGLERPDDFMDRNRTGYWRAAIRALAIPARSGRLLLVADGRGALFSPGRVTISQDSPDFSIVLKAAREERDPEGIRKRFRQMGITLVGLNYYSSSRIGLAYSQLGVYWTPDELGRYYAFFSRYAEQVGSPERWDPENGGWVFYLVNRKQSRSPGELSYLPGTEGLVWKILGESPERHLDRLRQLVSLAPTVEFFRVHLKGSAGY